MFSLSSGVGEEGDAVSEDSEDESEEECGIEALQKSGDLEDDDDEEDYAPGMFSSI